MTSETFNPYKKGCHIPDNFPILKGMKYNIRCEFVENVYEIMTSTIRKWAIGDEEWYKKKDELMKVVDKKIRDPEFLENMAKDLKIAYGDDIFD